MTQAHDVHTGSSFDSFLDEEGIRNEVEAVAVKRVIAWQIEQQRQTLRLSKKDMAHRLHTSRSQLDRLLDPENAAVHLETVVRAAKAVGMRLKIEVEQIPEAA